MVQGYRTKWHCMGNTKRTLAEKINYEVSTVEPRLSSNRQLLSKQQDLAKASEVKQVQPPRASSSSTIIV